MLDRRCLNFEGSIPRRSVSATTPLSEEDSGDDIGPGSIREIELLGVMGGISFCAPGVGGCEVCIAGGKDNEDGFFDGVGSLDVNHGLSNGESGSN